MAERGREKHQILSQIHGSEAPDQSHHHLISEQGTNIQQHMDMEKELLTYYHYLLTKP